MCIRDSFHSDHITVCAGDAANPDDLVTTLNMNDYTPDKKEKLTNDMAKIGHVLPDEFCE